MKFSCRYAKRFLTKKMDEVRGIVEDAHKRLHERAGEGSDFTGCLVLLETYDREEFIKIQKVAEIIRETTKVLIVIGIGGSYLGAKAAIESRTLSEVNGKALLGAVMAHTDGGVPCFIMWKPIKRICLSF